MSLSANVNEKAGLIWAIADKLTDERHSASEYFRLCFL